MICVICEKEIGTNHRCTPANIKKWEQSELVPDRSVDRARPYGERLEEGFDVLSDSFGD